MKLRAVSLMNVRRFTDPVTVGGISSGLNVLAAPNESGKSTLFDALTALITVKHGSTSGAVKALQPTAGGAPLVRANFETPDGPVTVSKRWLSRGRALIHRNGQLLAQADHAEAWIAQAWQHSALGPTGLLWLRQGETQLAGADPSLPARRSLLSTVEAQIDDTAGGERLDQVIATCAAALEVYQTGTGRPSKAIKQAQAEITRLQTECDTLGAQARLLQDDLEARRAARKDLAALTVPKAMAAQEAEVHAARTALAQAEQRAERHARLTGDHKLARTNRAQAEDALARLRKAQSDLRTAQAALPGCLETAETTKAAAEAARQALTRAQENLVQARAALELAEAQRGKVADVLRRNEIDAILARAETAAAAITEAEAVRAQGPSSETMRNLRALHSELRLVEAQRDAQAPQITMRYAPGQDGQVEVDGSPLPEAVPQRILGETVLKLGALGHLTILPGASDGIAAAETAQIRFADALAQSGFADLDSAERAAEASDEARKARDGARATLDALAPKGIAALRTERDALPAADPALPTSMPEAEEAVRIAQTAARDAEAQDRTAQAAAAEAQRAADVAEMKATDAEAQVTRAKQSELDLSDEALTQTQQTLDAARIAENDAAAALETARRDPVDLDRARETLTRAETALAQATQTRRRLEVQIATLDGRISTAAGNGVTDAHRAAAEALAAAERQLNHMTFEWDTLKYLARALDEAREASRDRYFAPVAAALRPMLDTLWPDAELIWDDGSLLPVELLRNGRREKIGSLSGGTIEQISVLVRLAYARVLQSQGRDVPVILDDALIFSDDARLSAMFDVLEQAAADVQIVVLTCRDEVFGRLNGHRLTIAPADPQALDFA